MVSDWFNEIIIAIKAINDVIIRKIDIITISEIADTDTRNSGQYSPILITNPIPVHD